MNNSFSNGGPIPVGFRFHPTDEELVGYYLHGKVGRAQRDQLIQELDLYKLEPWDLNEVCRIGDDAPENQSDWYFFSHKDKKYPTGNRANRATAGGFWKATGRDKPIHSQRSSSHQNIIGMRKTLVFYRGRAPHGLKTDWIMHEFRLNDGPSVVTNYESDGWVVCRVFKKAKSFKTKSSQDTTTSCSFELELDHPESQLILTENYMNSAEKRLLITGNAARRAGSGEEDVQYSSGHLDHHFNFTFKQEISVDDYGNPIPDSPFTVDSGSSTLHHLHDQLHRTILQGAVAGHPPLIVPRSTTSGSSLIRRCMQEAACRTKQQQLASHDQYSVAPAPFLNHNDPSSLRVDLDDARSSVTQELGRSCSSALPVLNNIVIGECWMLEPGARPDNAIQTRLHRAAGDLQVQRRDQTLGDVSWCHMLTMRHRTSKSEELFASGDHGNLVHLWNIAH